jgi:hypothetical protein
MVLYSALGDNKAATVADTQASVGALVDSWAGRVTTCVDLLGSGLSFVTALSEGVAMTTIVAAMQAIDTSCSNCSFLQPLCKGGQCVRPTCNDLNSAERPMCTQPSNAGVMARLMCSKTCGCSDPLSPMLSNGDESGCLTPCEAGRKRLQSFGTKVAGDENPLTSRGKCTDAQPNSTQLTALAQFAASKPVVDQFNLDIPNATVFWTTVGCFALNLYDKSALCDYDGSLGRKGMKSFLPFCPVTCGCTLDRLRQDACPDPCASIEPPIWNFKTDVPVGDYVEQNGLDRAVSDLTDRLSVAQLPLLPAVPTESEVAAFYRVTYGESIWKYALKTRLGVGGDIGSCRDLSDTQLAAANGILEQNPRWGKRRFPQSCSATNAAICADLLSSSLVFGGRKSADSAPEEALNLLVASHPCPVKCRACPPDSYRFKRSCFAKLRVSIDGLDGLVKPLNLFAMGTYTKLDAKRLNATEGDRPVYTQDPTVGMARILYLFYNPAVKSWFIGGDYKSSAGAFVTQGDTDALCPDQAATGWQGYAGDGWVNAPITIVQAGAPQPPRHLCEAKQAWGAFPWGYRLLSSVHPSIHSSIHPSPSVRLSISRLDHPCCVGACFQ